MAFSVCTQRRGSLVFGFDEGIYSFSREISPNLCFTSARRKKRNTEKTVQNRERVSMAQFKRENDFWWRTRRARQ
jgi:hypothetical protein